MSVSQERKSRAFKELERVAEMYVEVYGFENGLNEMGEELCKKIAPHQMHPDGWDGLLRHLIKISG
ncbi:hypothetical protein [Halomonas sp. I5-271120]|uniref:hypothetical protein n=1 Tax=Halomonas sp. I5-271120 TaxID=3061632 RepID=UPI002714E014|nr:hypothetical protein [Halomonas sp. I5-271120]